MEKIQTKRVICTQKKTESSAARPPERCSCKQVAVLKQYSWISSRCATIIITHCLPQQREVPASNSLRFLSNTNEAGSTNSISVMMHFHTKTWHRASRYCPNTSGEMWIMCLSCARWRKFSCSAVFLIRKPEFKHHFGITYLLTMTKFPSFFFNVF